jgi:hypothetical protein
MDSLGGARPTVFLSTALLDEKSDTGATVIHREKSYSDYSRPCMKHVFHQRKHQQQRIHLPGNR